MALTSAAMAAGIGKPLPAMPEFDEPPVAEVALSIEFLPLANWRTPHVGRYWDKIKDDYPNAEDMPAIPSQIERFDAQQLVLPQPIQFMPQAASRFWFVNPTSNYLVQIQRDRFIANWRKNTDGDLYPRYESAVRPRFLRELSRFREFVAESDLGQLAFQQCDVTYVNYIVRGEGWETFAEAVELFSFLTGTGSDGFLPPPEAINIAGSFRIPDHEARLHFLVARAIRQTDQREGIQVTLTARGRPVSDSDSDILGFMDMGREWIVRGFADLTSPKAHAIWKRTR